MFSKKKIQTHKKCPRCNNKVALSQTTCEECGLVFSRLEYASNKAAKRKLRKFDRDYIIYTTQYPKDFKYIKMLLLTIFLGLVGAHQYYAGKYIKGWLMSFGFIYTMVCVIFNPQLAPYIESSYLYLPVGILTLSWAISLVYVITKKYKVPIIVEMPKTENLRETVEEKKNDNFENQEKKHEKTSKKVEKIAKK